MILSGLVWTCFRPTLKKSGREREPDLGLCLHKPHSGVVAFWKIHNWTKPQSSPRSGQVNSIYSSVQEEPPAGLWSWCMMHSAQCLCLAMLVSWGKQVGRPLMKFTMLTPHPDFLQFGPCKWTTFQWTECMRNAWVFIYCCLACVVCMVARLDAPPSPQIQVEGLHGVTPLYTMEPNNLTPKGAPHLSDGKQKKKRRGRRYNVL